MIYCDPCERKGDQVAFNKRCGDKGPRIYQRKLRDQIQIRYDDVRLCRPLPVADGGAEKGLHHEADE